MEIIFGTKGPINVLHYDSRTMTSIKRKRIDLPLEKGLDDMDRTDFRQLSGLLNGATDFRYHPIKHPELEDHFLVTPKGYAPRPLEEKRWQVSGTEFWGYGPGVILVVREGYAHSADIPAHIGNDIVVLSR